MSASHGDRPRVLHLLDAPSRIAGRAVLDSDLDAWDGAADCCALLAERLKAWDHSVVIVGDAAAELRLERVIDADCGRIAPPAGCRALASRGINRILNERGSFDIVACWSSRTAKLAGRVARSSGVVVIGGAPVVHAVCADRAIVFDDLDGARWRSLGVEPERVIAPACAAADTDDTRPRVRNELGIGADDRVIVLAGDPAGSADAFRALYTVGTLSLQNEPLTLVVPTRSAQADRAFAMHRDAKFGWPMIETDLPLSSLLPAGDIALAAPWRPEREFDGRNAAMVRRAHAVGVPVVAPDGAWADGLYGDAQSMCCTENAKSAELATGLVRIWDAETLAGVSATVRAAAKEGDPDSAFVNAVDQVWHASIKAGTVT